MSSILNILKTSNARVELAMSQTTVTVRLNATLSDFVAANVSEDGAYENVSEYMRDLIRRDMERKEQQTFERLKAELTHAFASPDAAFRPLTAADVIARNTAAPKGA
jgi:antitoxin ParD1/3/4